MVECFLNSSNVDGAVIVIKLNHLLAILVDCNLVEAPSQLVLTQ